MVYMRRRDLFGVAAALVGPRSAATAAGTDSAVHVHSMSSEQEAMGPELRRFERRLELLRQSLDIPGMSVAVVRQRTMIYARGFGAADIARGTEATPDTPYPIASLTKPFASVVIMRLVQERKLDLDQPMEVYDPGYRGWCAELKQRDLPGARNFDGESGRITVRHHLTHTAQGTPGTAYAYNGLLFSRLSAVVDAVSDKSFIRSVEEDILAPLGMSETALGTGDRHKTEVIARMATPFKLDRNWELSVPDVVRPSFDQVSAAAGIISTVADLAKFDAALDTDQLYSPQMKEAAWTPAVSPTGQRFPYGLGWFVFGGDSGIDRMVWHYGWHPDAFSSLFFKVPERQLTLILLACTDRASSVFWPGNGDPLRSAFVTAFLDTFLGDRTTP
jgi:CubicO group peptidase (beta-lactamase class C family)